MPNTPGDGGAEILPFRDAAEFDAWLTDHHDHQPGVWLKLAKKSSGIPSLTDDEAVDIGLCWGWISGQRRALDETHYLQKYVPRRPRSRWSHVNVRKVEELTAAGRMRPPGIAEVEAAKADGRWDAAYVSQKEFTVPDDLRAALDAEPQAATAYDALSRTEQYAVVLDVVTARNPQTRAARVRAAVDRLASRALTAARSSAMKPARRYPARRLEPDADEFPRRHAGRDRSGLAGGRGRHGQVGGAGAREGRTGTGAYATNDWGNGGHNLDRM